ncbi:glycogenin-1-like isoform X1 [Dermacentor andersoni]|uniref:glycogenin-1-like isoform X1 n=1 Tax=Dermacentor andersoni TaxID=34620 RepID=UPI002155DE0A|nr:glycogenin-1-like isoform X1 [Dermacentor andersoni]
MESCCPPPPPEQPAKSLEESWVTLATDDTYAFGALVLGYSLREVRTRYKLTVLVTRDVGAVMRHLLAQAFDDIELVTLLRGRDPLGCPAREADGVACSYTKLHIWRLQQLSKGVFLDADTLVVANCDELFQRRELSAVPLRGWPDLFDTGVFVFQPSEKTHGLVMKVAREMASFDGVDRGVLNEVFGQRWRRDLALRLPFTYNLQGSAGRPFFDRAYQKFGESGTKIVHFWGVDKPWTQVYDWSMARVHPSPDCQHHPQHLQMWWDLFSRHVQPKLARHPCGDEGRKPGLVCREEICTPLYREEPSTAVPTDTTEPASPGTCGTLNSKTEASNEEAATKSSPSVRTRNQSVASLLNILGDTSIANIMQGSSRSDVARHDEDRYDAWERGEMDYTGADAFANIQRRLDEAIKGPQGSEKHEADEMDKHGSLSESTYLDVLTDS